MQLVLSIFPGIDLLGRGFEAEGFSVVRGPDLIWGGDIRAFDVPPYRFDGVIGGSPCQDFSKKRRTPPTGEGVTMLAEFCRVVSRVQPEWFLLENVPTVPDIVVSGYTVQRFDLNAAECGVPQNRPRHFQYGSWSGRVLVLPRPSIRDASLAPCVLGSDTRRDWSEICRLQGLPENFSLPGMSKAARYLAVGNGVPIEMARFIARAVLNPVDPRLVRLCACGCGRPVDGKKIAALPACRKRIQRAKCEPAQQVTNRTVTMPGVSQVTDQGARGIDGSQSVTKRWRDQAAQSQPGRVTGGEL